MATLFVDKLDPQSGTTLEIGSSGDTVNVAGTAGTGFGKVDYGVDESIQPSSFGGEQAMSNYAMSGIKTTLQNVTPYIETGSVTLAGLPAHAFATQIILPINGVYPLISSILKIQPV